MGINSFICHGNVMQEQEYCPVCLTGQTGSFRHREAEATKYDDGKLRMDLIPPEPLRAMAEILTLGTKKYGDRNWEKGMDWGRVYGAMLRHLVAHLEGEEHDSESHKPHLYHALCNLMFLVTYYMRGVGHNDIFPPLAQIEANTGGTDDKSL